MLHAVTILALVGSVACVPAPSTADDVASIEQAEEDQPKDGDAPKDAPEDAPESGPKDDDAGEPPSGEPPADPAPDEPPPSEPPPVPQLPPSVTTGEVKFINGEVPKVESFLAKMHQPVAQCVADHGGLGKTRGKVEIQFLVRLQGKAEGVEVLKREGVGEEAERCIRQAFKGKWVGTPTSDPTGVQFTYALERREK
jgi:hypothetical protein